MGKIIILYFILLPNILLGQYHIKTQKRLNYLEDSKEIVLFKVIVKNMSKDTILIPNKNCLLKKRYTQGFDDVSFELFSSIYWQKQPRRFNYRRSHNRRVFYTNVYNIFINMVYLCFRVLCL